MDKFPRTSDNFQEIAEIRHKRIFAVSKDRFVSHRLSNLPLYGIKISVLGKLSGNVGKFAPLPNFILMQAFLNRGSPS